MTGLSEVVQKGLGTEYLKTGTLPTAENNVVLI